MIDRRLRENSMAQVEDVSGAPGRLLEDPPHLTLDLGEWCEEDDGVQVPLNGDLWSQAVPALPQVDPPIESDHRPSGIALQFQERTSVGAEVDGRHRGIKQG